MIWATSVLMTGVFVFPVLLGDRLEERHTAAKLRQSPISLAINATMVWCMVVDGSNIKQLASP